MSSFCDTCDSKQYCVDCREETGEDLTEDFEFIEFSHRKKLPCNRVSICGKHLSYRGKCYEILYQEDIKEKNGSPNVVFRTYEGLTFYLREQEGGDFVLIKVVKAPQKRISSRRKETEFKNLEKNLLGSIPEGLLANSTW